MALHFTEAPCSALQRPAYYCSSYLELLDTLLHTVTCTCRLRYGMTMINQQLNPIPPQEPLPMSYRVPSTRKPPFTHNLPCAACAHCHPLLLGLARLCHALPTAAAASAAARFAARCRCPASSTSFLILTLSGVTSISSSSLTWGGEEKGGGGAGGAGRL